MVLLKNLVGNHGLPGESGGNVSIICNEIFNADRWTILSKGGSGADGQNGGEGQNGISKGKDAPEKWRKDFFNLNFPSMSKANGNECQMATLKVLGTIDELVPKENRTYGKDIFRTYDNWFPKTSNFFVEGTTHEGFKITVSKYSDILVGRCHTLILCKGNTFIYSESISLWSLFDLLPINRSLRRTRSERR